MTDSVDLPLCAFHVRDNGRVGPFDVSTDVLPAPREGYLWVHLDLNHAQTRSWLRANLLRFVVESPAQAETRPQCMLLEDGSLLTLSQDCAGRLRYRVLPCIWCSGS